MKKKKITGDNFFHRENKCGRLFSSYLIQFFLIKETFKLEASLIFLDRWSGYEFRFITTFRNHIYMKRVDSFCMGAQYSMQFLQWKHELPAIHWAVFEIYSLFETSIGEQINAESFSSNILQKIFIFQMIFINQFTIYGVNMSI